MVSKSLNRLSTVAGKNALAQVKVPASTRAHAFVTLGKLCLNDAQLANRCVVAFVKELHASPFPIVRNNIMVVLCDLAKRYTSLIDRYVVDMAACLKDENELVRRQTLMMLTHLMQEDYIKWNTSGTSLLFYRYAPLKICLVTRRFIVALVDESPQIREYAHCCLVSLLNKKIAGGTNVFYNNFLETIYYLNDYTDHKIYNQFKQSTKERTLFSLKGGKNAEKRQEIYKLFLRYLKDDQRFNLQSKLVNEILEPATEGILPLATAGYVILDTLSILSSKEIKMKMTRFIQSQGAGDDEETEQLVSVSTIQSSLLMHLGCHLQNVDQVATQERSREHHSRRSRTKACALS